MTVDASRVLGFFDCQESTAWERTEVVCGSFFRFRNSIWRIISELIEDADEARVADLLGQLHVLRSSCLTKPVEFNKELFEAIHDMEKNGPVAHTWGGSVGRHHVSACDAVEALIIGGNRLRDCVGRSIESLLDQGVDFRIFCNRRTRQDFDSLTDGVLRDENFLHSVVHYRDSEPFEVLVKVGPLRSRGWGRAPDALINAPRFERLEHIVWKGVPDEPEFGYDPAVTSFSLAGIPNRSEGGLGPGASCGHRLKKSVSQVGDDADDVLELSDEDELLPPAGLRNQSDGYRKTVLVQITDDHGMLFPPLSEVMSFDPLADPSARLELRLAGESLAEGMYIILATYDEDALGETQAEEGRYSPVWKQSLRVELDSNHEGFCRILRNSGIDLIGLDSCVKRWVEPATTVIHAPQQEIHFQKLIEALPLDKPVQESGKSWGKKAWLEIRRSRGEAIREGVQEQEILERELMAALKENLEAIQKLGLGKEDFDFDLSGHGGLDGHLKFFSVIGIEDGFLAPETEIKLVRDLRTIDQWRG